MSQVANTFHPKTQPARFTLVATEVFLDSTMASISNFLRFCFLSAYFLTRYAISVLSFGKRELDDAAWFYSIEHLARLLKACCYVISLAKAHPTWPSLVILAQIAWILWSAEYRPIQFLVLVDATIIMLDALAGCFDEEFLWKALSEFIIFTRISGRKSGAHVYRFQTSSSPAWRHTRLCHISLVATPWTIRFGFWCCA